MISFNQHKKPGTINHGTHFYECLFSFDYTFNSNNLRYAWEFLRFNAIYFPVGSYTIIFASVLKNNDYMRNRLTVFLHGLMPGSIMPALLFVLLVYGCKHNLAGVKKDLTTGLVTSYKEIEPEKAILVMNDEVINHTDIPIGEKFILINDGIDGLVIKNDKVKVGCYLQIADKSGNILLEEKDLFAGNDEFSPKDARMLKCTVSTGEPMKWEENYKVLVSFWDKQGKGRIDNTVTIKMIDLP